jgi:hypothetical protein
VGKTAEIDMISLDDLKNGLNSLYKDLFQKDIEDGDIEVPSKNKDTCWVNLCKFEDSGSEKHQSSIDLWCQTGWENSSPINPDDMVYAYALYRNGKDFFNCESAEELSNVITEDESLSKYYDEECYNLFRIKEKQLFLQYESSSNNPRGRANAIYVSYYFKQSETRKEDFLRLFLKELVDNNFLNEEEIEKIKQSILGKYLGDKSDTKERQYFIAKITKAPEIFAESVIHNHWRMQQRYGHEDYANAVTTNLNNAKQVQKGDILILDNGGGLYAYGVVKESPKNVIAKASLQGIIKKHAHIYLDKDGIISFDDCNAYYEQNYKGCSSDWSQFIDVERWESFCPKNPVSNSGVQDAAGGLSVHSIFGVKSEWAKGKIKELDEHFERNKTETDKMRENNKRLLEQKKNIILQGAPGTGKTYATAALALSLADPNFGAFDDHALVMARYEELQKKGQIAFTTFHQSLDYEDFVEGIKPQRKGDSVIYDIEDGIFKKIKDLALTNYEDSRKSDKELKSETDTKILFEKFCSKLEEDLLKSDSIELMPHSILKIRDVFRKSDGSAKSISISRTADSPYQSLSLDMVQRDYQKFKNGEIKSYEDIKPKYESKSLYHGNAIYYYELFKKMKAFEEANGSVTSAQTEKVELKNYVLIIDEINRGNISKIFGELISLLEADKRVGGDHPLTVTLPYSKESFSVPLNLYIIGTMNTTDRSVGSIDYAVRRRFAFVTLEADENAIENYYKGKDASLKNKAIELFGKVEAFLRNKDNRSNDMEFDDLMVGHSYFMAETLDELNLKWKYEVIPLLKEYQKDGLLRHSIDIEKDLNVEIQEAEV